MLRSVLDDPGKLAVVNIASAGSPEARPVPEFEARVTVGTSCWFLSHTSARVNDAPIEMPWLPCIQLSVSSKTFVEPSRALNDAVP